MQSCLYTGHVRHSRGRPVVHRFEQKLALAYLDLDEVESAFERTRWWAYERRAPVSYHRADYFGAPDRPLADCVRDEVARQCGVRPSGPVRLLAQLRHFGFCFNPAAFYYCFDGSGERLVALLCEVTNTPWNERHAYVVPIQDANETEERSTHECAKTFHVSPFMPMQQRYRWQVSAPDERLALSISSFDGDGALFAAGLSLERRPWSAASRLRVAMAFPFATALVMAGIYWQALRLYWKRAPFFPHPARDDASFREEVHD